MLPDGGMHSAAGVPDDVHLGHTGGKSEGMILHAGTASHIAYNNHTHPYPVLVGHVGWSMVEE
jgi:hypothetical protein